MVVGLKSELLTVVLSPAVIGLMYLFAVELLTPSDIRQHDHRNSASSLSRILPLQDTYDPDRMLLWQSQVAAMSAIGAGMQDHEFQNLWREYSRKYPELFEGTSADEWIRFLRDRGLVEIAGHELRLAPQGRKFISSMTRESATRHRPQAT